MNKKHNHKSNIVYGITCKQAKYYKKLQSFNGTSFEIHEDQISQLPMTSCSMRKIMEYKFTARAPQGHALISLHNMEFSTKRRKSLIRVNRLKAQIMAIDDKAKWQVKMTHLWVVSLWKTEIVAEFPNHSDIRTWKPRSAHLLKMKLHPEIVKYLNHKFTMNAW